MDFDKAAEDLRLATRHLGMIVGKVDVEEILGSIFNDFVLENNINFAVFLDPFLPIFVDKYSLFKKKNSNLVNILIEYKFTP